MDMVERKEFIQPKNFKLKDIQAVRIPYSVFDFPPVKKKHSLSSMLSLTNSPKDNDHSESPTFSQHQREYMTKHKDEIMPLQKGSYAVAIVSRAYR